MPPRPLRPSASPADARFPNGAPGATALPLLAIGAGLLAAGCGDQHADADVGHFLAAPQFAGEVELAVGEVDGDLVFDRIMSVEVGPDGNVYVRDAGEAGIRVFTPEGEPLRTLGRRGDGPGEFGGTPHIAEWRDDALLAWDGRRHTWLDLEGNVLSTETAPGPLQPGQETGINSPVFAVADGGFLYTESRPELIDRAFVHVSAEGEVLDTLHLYDQTSPERLMEYQVGGSSRVGPQPFFARELMVVQPRLGSLVVVDWLLDEAPRGHLVRRSFEGDTIYRVLLPHRPVLLGAETVDERVEGMAISLVRRNPELSEDAAQRLVRGALDVPEQVRPATQALGVADGGVWLRYIPEALGLEHPGGSEGGGTVWVDVDPRGEIRAIVALPPGFRPHPVPAREGADVWGRLVGELGVHRLARVRLRHVSLSVNGAP